MKNGPQSERLWASLLCLAIGLWLTYVAWSRHPGLNVPPAVGYLAAATFAAAGIALFLQGTGFDRASGVPAMLAVAAMAGIGGWIGFGPGSRRCGGSLQGLDFLPAEWICRFVFGAGAIITAGIVLLMLRSLVKGGPAGPERGGQELTR